MTDERYSSLMKPLSDLKLTKQEIAQGWHFCDEFDGLLRQPRDEGDTTGFKCSCLDHHPAVTDFIGLALVCCIAIATELFMLYLSRHQ